MYKKEFGTKNQIQFNNERDYYELLGYLAKSDGTTSLTWENNDIQGAWGKEGRIHFYFINPTLKAILLHTPGTGNIITRVNCNEFLQYIVSNHKFIYGKTQLINNIKNTIPQKYHTDFDRGFKL